jgi:stage II sporulation protein R
MIKMKKIIVVLFVLITLMLLTTEHKEEYLKIPDDSIRFRIIANSNSVQDQALKMNIKDNLITELNEIENNSNDLNSSRKAIKDNIPLIKEKLNTYNIPYSINYGNNYFPEKEYYNVKYNAGNYESLVITLGNGIGDNWWCVLFPPLCLIEAQVNNTNNINYEFYFKQILAKYN